MREKRKMRELFTSYNLTSSVNLTSIAESLRVKARREGEETGGAGRYFPVTRVISSITKSDIGSK